jgi:hypothetical protein
MSNSEVAVRGEKLGELAVVAKERDVNEAEEKA